MATLRGSLMGWTTFPSTAKLVHAQNVAKTGWIRWGEEPPWHMSTPSSTSSYGTLDLSSVQADIDNCHAHGQRVILGMLGVPRSVNSAASSADGEWHYYPTTSGGRATMAAIAVLYAAMLDPTKDVLELYQEPNIHQFNKGDQTAATIGVAAVPSSLK